MTPRMVRGLVVGVNTNYAGTEIQRSRGVKKKKGGMAIVVVQRKVYIGKHISHCWICVITGVFDRW
jgi:hypothetical protein